MPLNLDFRHRNFDGLPGGQNHSGFNPAAFVEGDHPLNMSARVTLAEDHSSVFVPLAMR